MPRPRKLIADKGYDSDLCASGCPAWHRVDRTATRHPQRQAIPSGPSQFAVLPPPLENRANLRLLGNFRRLVTRYERLIQAYRGFFHLACLITAPRHP